VKTTRCPTCKAAAEKAGNKLWPFCSERCHLVDLGRWLGEEYRIPAEPDSPEGNTFSLSTSEEGGET